MFLDFKLHILKEVTDASNKKALVIGAGGVSPSVIFLYKNQVLRILQY